MSGCGGRARGSCEVQGRKVELLLDERLEVDVVTGKRRRLRIASPGAAELAAAEAAQGSGASSGLDALASVLGCGLGSRPCDPHR